MIKIRALGARELKQVLHLLEHHSEAEFRYSALNRYRQLYIPLQQISQFFPPKLQFVPAIYVAVSQGKVLGLIWLSQDGKKNNRWKIDQLIIDPNEFSYDVGAQLVNFVINRYGGEGVQTFMAVVDDRYTDALILFKSCGFRKITRLYAYSQQSLHELQAQLQDETRTIQGLREAAGIDKDKLNSLYNDSLVVEVRLYLEKTPADFSKPYIQHIKNHLKGRFNKRWVVEDCVHDLLVASLEITTDNFKDFYFELFTSPAWRTGYESFIKFGLSQVLKTTQDARIYLQTYEFNREENEILETFGFKQLSSAEVLVKDYWVPIEDKPVRLASPILLFAGKTSPACSHQ